MEIRSVVTLTQLVERAEELAAQMRTIGVLDDDVRVPDVPLPLTIESTAEWLDVVDECRRRPRLARSKQLLEARGIDTAAISASVLEEADAIAELLDKIDTFPTELQAAAKGVLGRALTKGVEDATLATDKYSEAADAVVELHGDTASFPWIYSAAVADVLSAPEEASIIATRARDVLQHCGAAVHRGVTVPDFETLDEALRTLKSFNQVLTECNQRLAAEDVSDDQPSLEGQDVVAATVALRQHLSNLDREKDSLLAKTAELARQLTLIGGAVDTSATTLAELRESVPRLRKSLDLRRRSLRESLGQDVFRVIERLLNGELPTKAAVSDEHLGRALRKAIDGGYAVRLEVPREDQ